MGFDTLHAEAQRQLTETFSSFARRRLPELSRPDVDENHNLRTSIVTDQKPMGRNLRSTVGTATEVYTYLRLLYARCGSDAAGTPVADRMASFHFSLITRKGPARPARGWASASGHVLVCVTDVAGSGKSTLVHEVFARQQPDAVVVDRKPIGRSSRSNPFTYLGIARADASPTPRVRRALFPPQAPRPSA